MTYQIGGSLPESAPTYVPREADEVLYRSLLAGEYCAVLNARQMGKSSLVVQTIKRLRQAGITGIALDLSDLGSQQVSLEQWYGGVAFKMLSALQLFDIQGFVLWWQTYQALAPVQRLAKLVDDVILPRVPGQLVFFVDEIDSVLSVQYPLDDFFSWIRSCYNQRSLKPEYQRFSFTLLGVATPADLIQDPQRTPFNIGIAIDLQPFNLKEALPLTAGFKIENSVLAVEILEEILNWTGGQPFLTQKLCGIVSSALEKEAAELALQSDDLKCIHGLDREQDQKPVRQWVETIVHRHLLNHWETQDEPIHLRTIRNRLLRHAQQGNRILDLYDRILQVGSIALDNSPDINSPRKAPSSPEQSQLRLSGIVRCLNGTLQVYNPIYAHIFNRDWIQEVVQGLRPYGENFQAWIHSNQTDQTCLLRDQTLLAALAWAVNKHLSPLDYQFLAASRDLALQDAQRREAEGQQEIERLNREKDLLQQLAQEQEQRRAAELQLRRQQWQRRVSVTGSIASMLAFLCGVIWMHFNTQNLTLRLNRWLELGEQMLATGEPSIGLFYGLEAARLSQGAVGLDAKVELRLWALLDRSQRSLTLPASAVKPQSVQPQSTGSTDQSLLITPDGVVQRWVQGKLQQSIPVRRLSLKAPSSPGVLPSLFTIVPSPDPQQFVLQRPDTPTIVEIWHFREGLQGYLSHAQPVIALAWSQDAKLLATLTGPSSEHPSTTSTASTTGTPLPQLSLWYQDFSLVTQFPVPTLQAIVPGAGKLRFDEKSTVLNFQLGYEQVSVSTTPPVHESTLPPFTPLLSIQGIATVKQACQTFPRILSTLHQFSMPLPDRERSIQRFCKSKGLDFKSGRFSWVDPQPPGVL